MLASGYPPEGTIAPSTVLSLKRISVSGLLLANGYPHSVMTGPTTPGLHAVAGSLASLPPPGVGMLPVEQLPVLELQHIPPVQVRPGMQWFLGWHMHPSEPGIQSVTSTAPDAPSGITHMPALQTPLAQSGPVSHVVLGSSAVGMQSLPSHLPLSQSLAWPQVVPAGAPGFEPPFDVEPALVAPPPAWTDPSAPPGELGPASWPMSASLLPHPAKAAQARLAKRNHGERLDS